MLEKLRKSQLRNKMSVDTLDGVSDCCSKGLVLGELQIVVSTVISRGFADCCIYGRFAKMYSLFFDFVYYNTLLEMLLCCLTKPL